MLSHDTKLRCDLVDLYFTLYGSRRPTCLPIPELANVLKPQKIHAGPPGGPEPKRIKTMHPLRGNQLLMMDNKRNNASPVTIKQEVSDVIVLDNNIGIDMEVVVEEPKSRIKVGVFYDENRFVY